MKKQINPKVKADILPFPASDTPPSSNILGIWAPQTIAWLGWSNFGKVLEMDEAGGFSLWLHLSPDGGSQSQGEA